MRCSRPLFVAAFIALAFGASSAEAACSAAPTANTTDGLLSFATNPPAYGQVSGIPVADGALVYDSTTKLFKYCDGTNWVTLGATGTAAGSTGYVQFNTSGSLDSDSNFYWDKTNDRLGIGTTSPATMLHLYSTSSTPQTLTSSSGSNFIYFKNTSTGLGYIGYSNSGSGGLAFANTSASPTLLVTNSGLVGIGTTSPSYPLHVVNTSGSDIVSERNSANANPPRIWLQKSRGTTGSPASIGSGDKLGEVVFSGYSASGYAGNLTNAEASIAATITDNPAGTSTTMGTALIFATKATGATTNSERMRIDSSGKVGIGTISPSTTLDVNGPINARGYMQRSNSSVESNFLSTGFDVYRISAIGDASGSPAFHLRNSVNGQDWMILADVNATDSLKITREASTFMTVTATGNVGISTTAPAEQLTVSTTANVDKLGIYNFGTGKGNGVVFQPFADDAKVFSFRNAAATEVGSIVIKSASTLYNVASDRRLKENIASTTRGLADLLRLGVKDFNFISDPKKERVQGFIAQDFYKVYPEAVQVGGGDPKEHPWQVDYGRLTPLLVKAIQELKADNDNLRSDLAAAERRLEALEKARR